MLGSEVKMKDINIPAQIVMLLAFIVMISSFWCKKRESILKLQILSSVLFVTQYILLGAWTGAFMNFISIGRAYAFGKKNEHNPNSKIKWGSNWMLFGFVVAFIVASIATWDGINSIMALMATLVYTFAMWADKPQYIRFGANIASVFWVTYNFFVRGYVGCVTETILFSSNTIAIIKNRKKKDKE